MSWFVDWFPWLVAGVSVLVVCPLWCWAVSRRYRGYKSPAEFARLTADAVVAAQAAWQAEATLRGEYERRGRQIALLQTELGSLQALHADLLHKTVTEADYAELRKRLHAIRGAAQ